MNGNSVTVAMLLVFVKKIVFLFTYSNAKRNSSYL